MLTNESHNSAQSVVAGQSENRNLGLSKKTKLGIGAYCASVLFIGLLLPFFLVPFGMVIPVLLGSYLYALWRTDFPKKAKQVNMISWGIFLISLVYIVFAFVN